MKTATVGYSAAVLLLVVALVAPAAALKADQVTAISNGLFGSSASFRRLMQGGSVTVTVDCPQCKIACTTSSCNKCECGCYETECAKPDAKNVIKVTKVSDTSSSPAPAPKDSPAPKGVIVVEKPSASPEPPAKQKVEYELTTESPSPSPSPAPAGIVKVVKCPGFCKAFHYKRAPAEKTPLQCLGCIPTYKAIDLAKQVADDEGLPVYGKH